MHANVGDWLVVKTHTENQHPRRGMIVHVSADGAPPYTVRWTGDDHESLVFPGSDALVVGAQEPTT